ncbi:unnamed protein product [Rhizoctonia solani]|nr:unnamed protein product [Rhizoctonia solani]
MIESGSQRSDAKELYLEKCIYVQLLMLKALPSRFECCLISTTSFGLFTLKNTTHHYQAYSRFPWCFPRLEKMKVHPYHPHSWVQYQKGTSESGTRLLLLYTARVGTTVLRMLDSPAFDSNLLIKELIRVETEVFYLPLPLESTEFLPSLESTLEEPPVESPFDMKIIKLVARRITEGKSELSHVNAHFAYPSLVSLSHTKSITFNLWLSSLEHPIETLLSLAPHISIRLVRTVSVTARGSTVSEENIITHQTLRTSDMLNKTESHGQVLSFSGNIQIPKEMWRSWTVPRAARVSYSLRVSLPPNIEPEVAYIDHKVIVAFVSGSSLGIEHPDAPDLDAIPSPAALLKKHTVYMPMRV